jgi:UTP--glucose-1-phosphate uridylyltransferase
VTIRKAVITAAGRGSRLYPVADTVQKAMLPVVDRDGSAKPVIQIIAEEALAAGIEEICVVCGPGDAEQYALHFGRLQKNLLAAFSEVEWAQDQQARLADLVGRLQFAVQEEALGYGHAVYCAREFVGDEPFLLLLGDHLYVSEVAGMRCAEQLIQIATQKNCAVAAVQATREHLVGRFGTLTGRPVSDPPGAYQIEKVIEKPSVTQAEMELQTPGLRAGHYLCFFGMYALSPAVFGILGRDIDDASGNGEGVQLSPALQQLADSEEFLAFEVRGRRYDTSAKYGLLQAQLALALAGRDRDQALSGIVEVLAEAQRATPEPGD